MIEQAIYFALGCIVTALAALMFAPVFWNRALRITRKRLQLQVPLSTQEIYAERDQMRAAFAVERLRLEQELERVLAGKARDMAEAGRRGAEATRLASELAAVRAEFDASRGTPAEAGRRAPASAATKPAADGVAARHVQALEEALATSQSALADAREREKGFHLLSSLKAERERSADRQSVDRFEALEAENAALHEALRAARSERADAAPADDRSLRESIHALGVAVAAMTRDARRDAPPEAPTDAGAGRDQVQAFE